MSPFLRALAFFAVGAAIVFVLDLAPPDASGLALLGVLLLAFVGGLLATSRIEVAALTIGSIVGGSISAFVQLGQSNGPDSMSAALSGIVFIGVLMWFVGTFAFGVRTRVIGPALAAGRPAPAAAPKAPRELRPNTLSIELRPNRLSIMDRATGPGRRSTARTGRAARR